MACPRAGGVLLGLEPGLQERLASEAGRRQGQASHGGARSLTGARVLALRGRPRLPQPPPRSGRVLRTPGGAYEYGTAPGSRGTQRGLDCGRAGSQVGGCRLTATDDGGIEGLGAGRWTWRRCLRGCVLAKSGASGGRCVVWDEGIVVPLFVILQRGGMGFAWQSSCRVSGSGLRLTWCLCLSRPRYQ